MTRKQMIDYLMWDDGTGTGHCSVGMTFLWELDRPSKTRPDLKSIVTITGPPAKYTDEELAKLVKFATVQTARYDMMFEYRRGANLICLNKEVGELSTIWLRKRLSWYQGPMYSDSLDEALQLFKLRS